MSRKTLTVFIVANEYVILDSPDPLRDTDGMRCKVLIDHDERVIWIDSLVSADERMELILRAVSRAWQERLRLAEIVE